MNTCQIQQTTKTLKFVPANNTSLKVYMVESVRTYISNTHAHVRMSVCY